MTFEQLLVELFAEHWLFTTIVMPTLTFVYAWITDQTGWWIGSLTLSIGYALLAYGSKR